MPPIPPSRDAGAILATHGLTKSFGAVPALRGVSFSLARGELRALCGENGAGKSTFVKMLMGIVAPDSGTIAIDGKVRSIGGAQHAQALGLGLVAQELSLAPHLSIYDNIWLGSAETPFFHRPARLRERARDALAMLGVGHWQLDTPVGSLSLGQRQLVEIARLLSRDARILILDEPTATLSDVEITRLAEVLRSLREAGRSVIYISHRLGEVFDLCDSVTVFRNGEQVATAPVASFSRDRLIETMLGRSVGDMYPPKGKAAAGKIALAANGLRVPGAVFDFSVSVPTGAIVAIAGQVGSGAATVTRAMAGLVREAEGAVEVHGRRLRLGSVRRAVSRDVLFVTDDRAGEGIFRGLTAQDNLVAMRLAAHRRAGILSWADLRRLAARLAGQVRLPPGRLRAQAGDLSGGNQQKLVFARAVERPRPCILLMNEPTRGIDVGARAEIYRLMRRFCEQGYAIVMTSSDLEEIAAMADIVYTMYRGRGVARYEGTAIEGPIILRDIAHPDTHSLHAA